MRRAETSTAMVSNVTSGTSKLARSIRHRHRDLTPGALLCTNKQNKKVEGRGGVMWCRDLVAGMLLAGVLGACAVVDPVDPRYDTVNRSLAKARNESILLNIIRSSHDWPMSFTTVPQVNPIMQNVTTVGLPSFLMGPNPRCAPLPSTVCLAVPPSPGRDVIFGNQQNFNNSTTVSSNFSVSSLENGSFYSGLLSPVSLHDLNYFIRQGYSRELLFWLFADAIEIEFGRNIIGYQFDPPYDYGCR